MDNTTAVTEQSAERERQANVRIFKEYYDKNSLFGQLPTWSQVVCALAVIFGNVLNAWILYVGLRKRCELVRRSPFQALIISNSLLKVFVGVTTWPILFYWFTTGGPPDSVLEEELCSFTMFTLFGTCILGMCNNGLIAFNRTLSCYPHWKISSFLSTVRATLLMIGGTWMVCYTLLVIPVLMYRTPWKRANGCLTLNQYVDEFMNAEFMASSAHSPIMLICRYLYAIAMLSILVASFCCYALIFRKLWSKDDRITQLSKQRKRDRKRALYVIMLGCVIFSACWLPNMTLLWRADLSDMRNVFLPLILMEAVANPLMYLFTIPTLRPNWWQKMQNSVSGFGGCSSNKAVTRSTKT